MFGAAFDTALPLYFEVIIASSVFALSSFSLTKINNLFDRRMTRRKPIFSMSASLDISSIVRASAFESAGSCSTAETFRTTSKYRFDCVMIVASGRWSLGATDGYGCGRGRCFFLFTTVVKPTDVFLRVLDVDLGLGVAWRVRRDEPAAFLDLCADWERFNDLLRLGRCGCGVLFMMRRRAPFAGVCNVVTLGATRKVWNGELRTDLAGLACAVVAFTNGAFGWPSVGKNGYVAHLFLICVSQPEYNLAPHMVGTLIICVSKPAATGAWYLFAKYLLTATKNIRRRNSGWGSIRRIFITTDRTFSMPNADLTCMYLRAS